MTVSATTVTSGPYVGNGSTTAFPFSFSAGSAAEVVVTLDNIAQTAGLIVTLSTVGDGGTVTFVSPPASGVSVLISSNPLFTQEISFSDAGQFLPSTHDQALDQAARRTLYLKDQVGRAIKVPLGETLGQLPSRTLRAGQYFAYDGNGDPVASAGTGADIGLRTDLVAQTGSSLINHTAPWSGAITRTVQDKLRDLPHIYDIILPANRNTSYDATADLNKALATGERFVLPNADLHFAGTLQLAVDHGGFVGQGYSSGLIHTSATGDMIQVGDGTNQVVAPLFQNFRMWSTVQKTAGFAINSRFVTFARFERVFVGSSVDYSAAGSAHRLYKGHAFNGFFEGVVYGGQVVTANDCVTINGKVGQDWGAELSFDGGLRMFLSGGSAFYLGGSAGGIHLGRLDVSQCHRGITCDTLLTTEPNRELFLHAGCTIDSCTDWGVYIDNNGLQLLEAPGGWISGHTAGGLKLATGAATRVRGSGLRIYGNFGDGVDADSGNLDFSGAELELNGRQAGGGYGARIRSGVSRLEMNGTKLRENGNSTVGRGAYFHTGADNFAVENFDATGNGQTGDGLEFQGGLTISASKFVRGGKGFKTEGQGQATIVAGQTIVTVTHGLSSAPQYPQIAPIGHRNAACVQNLTATTFDIALAATLGSDVAFQWSMRAES